MRLLPPLLFGMVVVVPPQTWLQLAQASAAAPLPYGAFWLHYLTASGHRLWRGKPLVTPTWNHLWFVAYLLVYTLLLALALKLTPKVLERLQSAGERALRGPGLLLWPLLWLIVVRWLLAPYFPETHALIGDWTVHAESLAAFLFGYLFAKSDALWAGFVRWRWWTLAAALLAYTAYAAVQIVWPGDAVPPQGVRFALREIYPVDQWAWIAAILGFARLHVAGRDNAARRYLTEAIFPFYIVHQTIIVCTGYWLTGFALPAAVEAAIVIAATVGGCFATFEIVRRIAPLRPLFGLRLTAAH